jgi:dihydrodipicolinate synthase/N-acetylneuraminate lyase
MKTRTHPHPATLSRRDFLQVFGAGALTLGLAPRIFGAAASTAPAGRKALRGIFPIAQSPFTADDKLDVAALAKQVSFCDRGGVHGIVWPQLASEWATLSEAERMAGMEAMGDVARKTRPALVLGVQGADNAAVRRYVKQAEKVGADAIIALPPSDTADRNVVLKYYQEIGGATALPFFVQAVGNMDIDLVMELFRTIPTVRYIKDEAGDQVARATPLREKSKDALKLFSGNHGRRMMEELAVGFSGSMPATGFADMYATTFDLWQAGKRDAAKESHERTMAALEVMLRYGTEGMKYALVARGVFTTWSARRPAAQGGFAAANKMATGGKGARAIDDAGKKALEDLVASLKPHLKA